MGMPTHGEWCGARTWKTLCPTCGEQVYFFMCNCGCRVYFDDLGNPWPIHDCDTSWTRKLIRTTDETGTITVRLSEGINVIRPSKSIDLDAKVIERVKLKRISEDSNNITSVNPKMSENINITGVLREIFKEVDPFVKFNLPKTDMAYAFLGPIGKQSSGKITVHVHSNSIESFTTWIPSCLINDSRIKTGLTVFLILKCQKIKDEKVWFCDCFEVLG